MNWHQWQGRDLLLQIHAQPGAKRSEFAGLHGAQLKVRIHAPASDGKANTELLEFLSTSFAVAKQQVVLKRGDTGRNKTVHIAMPRQIPVPLAQLGLVIPG